MTESARPLEGAASRRRGDGDSLRVAPLGAADRARVEAILRATAVFRDDEVEVALELFDETYSGCEVSGVGSGPAGRDVPRSATPDTPRPTPDDYTFVGAFTAAGVLVGYACYGPTPATDRTYDLYWIAVDPAAQGSGGGTLLLDEVERRLRDARGRLIVVETSSRAEYDATRRFYTARGYDEAARVGHFYAPGDDRVIYTKRLSDERLSALGSRLSAETGAESREPRAESSLT